MAVRLCDFEDCIDIHYAKGYCGMHYKRYLKHGDPSIVVKSSGMLGKTGLLGERNPGWVGNSVTYNGMHRRIKRTRGPASNYKCPCGKLAQHWAYDGTDENEIREENLTFSTDENKYIPMCISCHLKKDNVQPTKAAHDAGSRARSTRAQDRANERLEPKRTY